MAKAYASGVVPAPVEEVWATIRRFNGLPEWHPAIEKSEIVEGADEIPGAVRKLSLGGDGSVSERLVSIDETAHSCTYEFTDPGPFAVRTYVSTFRLAPVSKTGETFMEWFADFDAEADDEAAMADAFAGGVYLGGIDALITKFG